MSRYTGGMERLEVLLAEAGQGMRYPPTPELGPAALARVRDKRARRPRWVPALFSQTRRLVLIISLTLSLIVGTAVAYALLYPVPEGFDISASLPGEGGRGDVFIITADDLEQLTSNPAQDTEAKWSPDCSRILFNSNRDGVRKIHIMNPDGTGVVKLLDRPNTVDGHGSWSPDGTRIAFSRAEAYWEPGLFGGGQWLPSDDSDIYMVNADGSGLTRVTSGPGHKGLSDWSPDGRRILFEGDQQEENGDVFVINVDGTGLRNLTNDAATDFFAKWSPDGKRIVFASNRAQMEELGPANPWNWPRGGLDIYVMDADGGNVTRLTDHPENDMLPYWSPDGKWISFTSARISGRGGAYEAPHTWDIFVMKADGSELQHVIQGKGHGWSSCKAQR